MQISHILKCLHQAALGFLLLFMVGPPAEAQDDWRQSRSRRFTVIGDADASDTQEVIARLEGIEGAVSQFFRNVGFRPLPALTAVVLDGHGELGRTGLKDRDTYVFVGSHQTYIVLTDPDSEESLKELLHLYFHEMAAVNIPNAPLWLQEGLAAFYSTTQWSDDGGQLITGLPIDSYVRRVRNTRDRMGLTRLSEITSTSEAYDEVERDSMFYAESWALVHFLMTRDGGHGHDQTSELVRLMASGLPFEEAVDDAFDAGFRSLLSDFDAHVEGRGIYPRLTLELDPAIARTTPVGEIPEIEAATHLGALFIAAGLPMEAESHLRRAIALGGDSAQPYTALAPLLIDQERFDEARLGLDHAMSRQGSDHLTYYYYALSLIREGSELGADKQARIERELRAAIDIDPGFADGYHELAMSLMDTPDGTDEAVELVQAALDLDPGHADYLVTYGQILIEQERFDDARNALLPLIDNIRDAATRERGVDIMQSIAGRTDGRGLVGKGFAEITTGASRPGAAPVAPTPQPGVAPVSGDNRVRLTRVVVGEQQPGLLTLLDCRDGLALTLEDSGQVHVFFTDSPERVEFTSISAIGAEVRCGIQDSAPRVVVTFRPAPDDSEYRGVPVKVEFIED